MFNKSMKRCRHCYASSLAYSFKEQVVGKEYPAHFTLFIVSSLCCIPHYTLHRFTYGNDCQVPVFSKIRSCKPQPSPFSISLVGEKGGDPPRPDGTLTFPQNASPPITLEHPSLATELGYWLRFQLLRAYSAACIAGHTRQFRLPSLPKRIYLPSAYSIKTESPSPLGCNEGGW